MRIAVGAKSFFIHPASQDKALTSRQASAALKLPVVLVYSLWSLNRAAGHHLHRDYEQKPPPAPGACTHSGSDGKPAGRGEGNATGAGCAQGRDTLSPGRDMLRVFVGARNHELLSQGSRNCKHGSDRSQKTALAHKKMYPELPAWLPFAHFSSSN